MWRLLLCVPALVRAARIYSWLDPLCKSNLVSSYPFFEDRCTNAIGGQFGGVLVNCSNNSAVYVGFYAVLGLEPCPFPFASADVMNIVEFRNSSSCVPWYGSYLSLNTTVSPCRAGDAPVLNVGGCTGYYYSVELGACVPSSSLWTDAAATTTLNADGTVTMAEYSYDRDPLCSEAPFCVYANVTTDGKCRESEPRCGGRAARQPMSITLADAYPAPTPTPSASTAAGPSVPLIVGGSLGLGLLVAAAFGAWRCVARAQKERGAGAGVVGEPGYAALGSLQEEAG